MIKKVYYKSVIINHQYYKNTILKRLFYFLCKKLFILYKNNAYERE